MRSLFIDLSKNSYSISIGNSILTSTELLQIDTSSKIAIVTDHNVAPYYLEPIRQAFVEKGYQVDTLILNAGESYKTLQSWYEILTHLIENYHDRKSTLIALGGGVVGDMVGFAASCYQRGIDFIQIPTTLLAQVDSSVGGKTAINHPLAKNMIGSFYQPKSVLIDIKTLHTLPKREFSAGMAEVIKYGVMADAPFFNWLEANIDKLMAQEETALIQCVERCCLLKAKFVQDDETEQSTRALLNLGHTYGHAIETELGFGSWLHGEAVAVGIIMACHLSHLLGNFSEIECDRVVALIKKANLPTHRPKNLFIERYLQAMRRDKKTLSDNIRLVIPITLGQAKIVSQIDKNLILQSIKLVESN